MLLFKISSHPAVVLASLAVIVVAGEASAGLYVQFFILNLLSLNIFAVVGLVGLAVLFLNYMVVRPGNRLIHSLMNCTAICLLMLSVITFFYWLPWRSCYQTFTTIIPLCTVVAAAVCSTAFLVKNIGRISLKR